MNTRRVPDILIAGDKSFFERTSSVKNLALAAAAAVVLTMAVASASAAGRHAVSTEPPMGDQGARYGGLCWVVGSGGVSTYHGYWAPCK